MRRDDLEVRTFAVWAENIGETLTAELALLLSRAFTDERHLAQYPGSERERWLEAARSEPPEGRPMPGEWLRQFPSLRNLEREPGERLAVRHFLRGAEGMLGCHVALFPREFRVDGGEALACGFIEDVATDPEWLGQGHASGLLESAAQHALRCGLHALGLSTGIPAFYERLGWQRWVGIAQFATKRGSVVRDHDVMILPLSGEFEELAGAGDGFLDCGTRAV